MAAVAGVGLILRESAYRRQAILSQMAKQSFGEDSEGYRREFVRLIGVAQGLY